MNRVPDDKEIDFLISQKFPGWNGELELRLPALGENFTLPLEADLFLLQIIEEFDLRTDFRTPLVNSVSLPRPSVEEVREWINEFIAYRVQLETMDWLEFRELYTAERRRAEDEILARRTESDRHEFFNEPAASADLEYWNHLDAWTVEEAVALSMGRNPIIVSAKSLGPRGGSPFVQLFRRRVDAVKRAISVGNLSEPLVPRKFVAWAREHPIFTPSFAFFAKTSPSTDNHAPADDAPTAVYKMLVGIAVSKYGIVPTVDGLFGSKVFEEISNDLGRLGINIHSDTIKKHLEQGAIKASKKAGDWNSVLKRFKGNW